MKITKITIEGEDGNQLFWTPFIEVDHIQLVGTFCGMLEEFGYFPPHYEDDMVDDE